MGNTKIDLVNDLQKTPQTEVRDKIIHAAQRGTFHDFESPLAAPKMALIRLLEEARLKDIIKKVMNGDYDE